MARELLKISDSGGVGNVVETGTDAHGVGPHSDRTALGCLVLDRDRVRGRGPCP